MPNGHIPGTCTLRLVRASAALALPAACGEGPSVPAVAQLSKHFSSAQIDSLVATFQQDGARERFLTSRSRDSRCTLSSSDRASRNAPSLKCSPSATSRKNPRMVLRSSFGSCTTAVTSPRRSSSAAICFDNVSVLRFNVLHSCVR